MQTRLTNLANTKFKLTVSADQAFMDRLKQSTLAHLGAKHVKLPGFRAGKAPLNLIEKHVDPNLLQQEFLEEAINRLYPQALRVENLKPVSDPKISIKKFVPFSTLEFEAEIEAVGEIKLPDYKKIKVDKPKITITAKDINQVLESLQSRQAERTETDKPAKTGDEMVIDFKGTDSKGEPVNGADGKEFPIVIGSNTFIPGFEPNLVGLKAGDSKTFEVTFPKNYGVKTLQSKNVKFEVKARKINQLVKPKLDDKFAAKVGPFKTLAELKTDIKKQLEQDAIQRAEQDFENRLINEIATKTKVIIPEILVEDQVSRSEQVERQNLTYRGQTWQEHLEAEGITEEEHRQQKRPEAEATVKASLALSEVAAKEQITVTQDELDTRIQLLKGQYKDAAMQAELDKPENRNDIANRLLTEKTIAKLKEYASK